MVGYALTMNTRWEHFEHQADIGVRGYGRSLAEAFEQIAMALTAVITQPEGVSASRMIVVRCEAPDSELLLADWLNAVLREMSALRMVFSRFSVELEGNRLKAKLWGERLDQPRHQPVVEVKGASYHRLKVVKQDDSHWMAQCVVDV